jgi:hypothetical protein
MRIFDHDNLSMVPIIYSKKYNWRVSGFLNFQDAKNYEVEVRSINDNIYDIVLYKSPIKYQILMIAIRYAIVSLIKKEK